MNGLLIVKIHQALPQTQCRKCSYQDCLAYATAIVEDNAPHNQCPPGGQEGVSRLGQIMGRALLELNTWHGVEKPRSVAVIDPNRCIGCTLCIDACPVDAIVGTNKMLHQVVETDCTGCELCIPPCPVDCIDMLEVTESTGWDAWTIDLASNALARYQRHATRIQGRLSLKQSASLPTATSSTTINKTDFLNQVLIKAKERFGEPSP